MDRKLQHAQDVVEVVVLAQIADVLRHDDDVDDLEHLAGLDADGAEAQPALVAGVVREAEGDQRQQQQGADRVQDDPLVGDQVDVQHREQHEQRHADQDRQHLDHQKAHTALGAVGRGAGDDDEAEDRADQAEQQQRDVRPVQKFLCQRRELLQHIVTSIHLPNRAGHCSLILYHISHLYAIGKWEYNTN